MTLFGSLCAAMEKLVYAYNVQRANVVYAGSRLYAAHSTGFRCSGAK